MTRARGISTVVDVSMFLLLVSAAIFSVVTAGNGLTTEPTTTADRDEATVETLATVTATVRYDLGIDDRTGESIGRVRHGTLAGLLAEAAISAVAVDGERVSPYAGGFVDAVGATVRPVLDGRTQVVATWRPFPGGDLAGRVRVGPTPPADATVHAATLAVDSGAPATREPALAVSDEGYGRVADVVARRTVEGLFPDRRTQSALRGGGADATVIRSRFASMRSAYGSETTLETGVTPARTDLAVAISKRTERTFRNRFETPRAAASSVRTGRVTIVVRTWS